MNDMNGFSDDDRSNGYEICDEKGEILMSYMWAVQDQEDADEIDGIQTEGDINYVNERRVNYDIEKLQKAAIEEGIIDSAPIETSGGTYEPAEAIFNVYNELHERGLINIEYSDMGQATDDRFSINALEDDEDIPIDDLEFVPIRDLANRDMKDLAEEILESESFPKSCGWDNIPETYEE